MTSVIIVTFIYYYNHIFKKNITDKHKKGKVAIES